jgi:hypothetical protein
VTLIAGGSANGNVFAGPIPVATGVPQGTTTVPLLAIGCLESGGTNTPLLNGGATKVREPLVTVHVRSSGDAYTTGLALANAVKDRLNAASVSGYVGLWANEVVYGGSDETGAHHWNITVRCMWAG